MDFSYIEKASATQIAFCLLLDLDVAGNTAGVAAAKLDELIQKSFWGTTELKSPTEKQIALAKKFKIDISSTSRIVGNAIIDDIMTQLNFEALSEQNLKPGVYVRNKYDKIESQYVISSISENGTVYFKGGNGKRAWARNLICIEKA